MTAPLYMPSSNACEVQVSAFLHLVLLLFFCFQCPNRWSVLSHFPRGWYREHFFMCLSAIHTSFWVKYLHVFAHFLFRLFLGCVCVFFFLLSYLIYIF